MQRPVIQSNFESPCQTGLLNAFWFCDCFDGFCWEWVEVCVVSLGVFLSFFVENLCKLAESCRVVFIDTCYESAPL